MEIRSKQDQYAHYSDYYQKRFEEDEAEGHTFIRNVTAKAEPSAGYLALANVMTGTANNIVLTTILISWWRPPFFVIQPKFRGLSARKKNSNIWICMRTTPKF